MCQYNASCPIGRHRPGTVCPYSSGRAYGTGRPPAWAGPTVVARPSAAGPRRYRTSAASAGVSLGDLLIVIVVAAATDRCYEDTGWWGVMLAVLAVVLPFALATWLTWTCTAWNGTVEGRCGNPRHGWRRCEKPGHGRTKQFVTAPELAAVVSVLVGVVNAAIIFRFPF